MQDNKDVENDEQVYGEYLDMIGKKTKGKKYLYHELFD